MINEWKTDDAFDVIPNLSDNSFEMILTDPPYDFSHDQIDWLHNQFCRVCSGVIIVFSPWTNPWRPLPDQKLFWTKPVSTKNTSKRYSNFVEEVFIYGVNKWNTQYHWSNYTNILTDKVDDIRKHNWRKPPAMIERFIKLHSDVGDWILDPFAGSGVVHDACILLGRNSLSIEIENCN